jgi:hypothetical protein
VCAAKEDLIIAYDCPVVGVNMRLRIISCVYYSCNVLLEGVGGWGGGREKEYLNVMDVLYCRWR